FFDTHGKADARAARAAQLHDGLVRPRRVASVDLAVLRPAFEHVVVDGQTFSRLRVVDRHRPTVRPVAEAHQPLDVIAPLAEDNHLVLHTPGLLLAPLWIAHLRHSLGSLVMPLTSLWRSIGRLHRPRLARILLHSSMPDTPGPRSVEHGLNA